MIRSKHFTTTFVAATSLAATFPAGAAAHHIVGHSTLSAVQQDVQAAAEEAERQVSSVRSAIENTGANTRRHLQETVDTQVQAVERSVNRTRSSAQAQVEQAQDRVRSTQRSVSRRVAPVVAYGQSRAGRAIAEGEERAERTSAGGRRRAERARARAEQRAQRERSSAEQRAQRTWAYAEDEYAMAKRRAQVLVYRVTHEVDALVASGSVGVSTSGGEYSAGWTRSGGCWTVRLSTPLNPPNGRIKRGTGKSIEPVEGQRTTAQTSSGDVTASTGC